MNVFMYTYFFSLLSAASAADRDSGRESPLQGGKGRSFLLPSFLSTSVCCGSEKILQQCRTDSSRVYYKIERFILRREKKKKVLFFFSQWKISLPFRVILLVKYRGVFAEANSRRIFLHQKEEKNEEKSSREKKKKKLFSFSIYQRKKEKKER